MVNAKERGEGMDFICELYPEKPSLSPSSLSQLELRGTCLGCGSVLQAIRVRAMCYSGRVSEFG